MHLEHATFVAVAGRKAEEDKTKKSGPRLRKTKKKWIDGSRVQDQEEVGIDGQDPRSNHYTDAQVGDAEGLFKSLWIKTQRSNHYTDAQVGDAEGLFKSLWIIILPPQVNLSICLSL